LHGGVDLRLLVGGADAVASLAQIRAGIAWYFRRHGKEQCWIDSRRTPTPKGTRSIVAPTQGRGVGMGILLPILLPAAPHSQTG